MGVSSCYEQPPTGRLRQCHNRFKGIIASIALAVQKDVAPFCCLHSPLQVQDNRIMSRQRVSPSLGGGQAALYRLLRVCGFALAFLWIFASPARAHEKETPPTLEAFVGGILAFALVLIWIFFSSLSRPRRSAKPDKLALVERRLPAGIRRLLRWNPTRRRQSSSKMSRQQRRAYLRRR